MAEGVTDSNAVRKRGERLTGARITISSQIPLQQCLPLPAELLVCVANGAYQRGLPMASLSRFPIWPPTKKCRPGQPTSIENIASRTWHPGIFTWPHFKEYDPGPLHGQLMPIIDSYRVKPVIQGFSEPRQRFLIAYKCLGYQLIRNFFGYWVNV